jgi:PKD repeat protein
MFSFAKGNVIFSSGDIDGASQLYPVTPPSAPFPFISASSGTGPAPLNVLFSSKQSASRIGETLTAEWDFGDGSPTSTELEPLHTYTAVGQYTATLIVQDSFGSATTTKIIIVGDSSKPLTVTKFKFKTLLLVPLNLIRGRDVLQMTLENTDLQIGDVFFLSVNRVNLTSESGGTLDSHLQFKSPKGVDGTLSLKLNAKKNSLTVSLTGATLGLGFDPRISSDTSRNGVASFPIVLRIQRGNQQIVQTSEATFSYEVKAGSTPNGFFEKSIAGIKN